MTCQECELALGMNENAAAHLAVCPDCQALAEEMRTNTLAMEAFADDALPGVRYRVMAQVRLQSRARRILRWGWALAAAAMLVVCFAMWNRVAPAPQLTAVVPPRADGAPVRRTGEERTAPKPPEVLKVKMFTDDPDVVIYWLVEKKEGTE